MNELLRHLSEDNLGEPYRDEISQTSEYGHIIAFLYMMIKRAIVENADMIEATTRSLLWSRDGKVINKVHEGHSDYPSNYANEIRKIINKDPIVKKWTRIVSDTN